MLPEIYIRFIKGGQELRCVHSASFQYQYAFYESGEYSLKLFLGDSGNSRLYFKNVEIYSHGLNASHWSFHVDLNSSNKYSYATKILSNNRDNFEFYDRSQSDGTLHYEIKKKAFESNNIENKVWQIDEEFSKRLGELEHHVFEICIAKHDVLYDLISDKDSFKVALLMCEEIEYLLEDCDLSDDANYDDDIEAEIEKFAESSLKYFKAFLDGEHSNDILEQKLTVQALYSIYPEIVQVVDADKLQCLISDYKNNFNRSHYLSYKSIYFNKETFVEDILDDFINGKLKDSLVKRLNEKYSMDKVIKLFKNEINSVIDSNDLIEELEKFIERNNECFENEFVAKLKGFLNNYLIYDSYYKKFYIAFGGNSKTLYLTDEKESKFNAFENGELELSSEEKNEYDLIYKVIMPSYMTYFFIKNKNILKPSILRVPLYFEYVQHFFECLLKNDVIVEKEGVIDFKLPKNIELLSIDDYEPAEYYKKRRSYLVLKTLKEKPDISNREISERLGFSKNCISEIIKKLCKERCIEKVSDGKHRLYIVKYD